MPRLTPGPIWAIAEVTDGRLARVSSEIATAARLLAEAAGVEVAGIVVAAEPEGPANELARFAPRVLAVAAPEAADRLAGPAIATRLATLIPTLAEAERPAYILVAATPDGRDLAGTLSALLGWGVLVNAVGLTWQADASDGYPVVAMSVFGGKVVTTNRFSEDHGIVTVRANAVTAAPLESAGAVERADAASSEAAGTGAAEGAGTGAAEGAGTGAVEGGEAAPRKLPLATVEARVAEPGAAVSLEDARVIVAGGRGLGGPEGFQMVEELAGMLGGAVGATRAAVDAGWIPYSYQIGQTGRIVKPSLYVALGISGAIQHKVGMQTAETIVAVNRDAEAPIGEFADVLVVGDVFEVVPELVAALRERAG